MSYDPNTASPTQIGTGSVRWNQQDCPPERVRERFILIATAGYHSTHWAREIAVWQDRLTRMFWRRTIASTKNNVDTSWECGS